MLVARLGKKLVKLFLVGMRSGKNTWKQCSSIYYCIFKFTNNSRCV